MTHHGKIKLRAIEAVLFRAPAAVPVRTSFAVSTHRSALLVRIEDADGAYGWGEIYASFPPGSGEHRLTLLRELFIPLALATPFAEPPELYHRLTQATRVLSLQCGELGPFAQIAAGLDIAAWDLVARRAGVPLWRRLGATEPTTLRPYASGINPEHPDKAVAAEWENGFRAFKLKLGFGRDTDLGNVAAVRTALGDDVPVMLDPNQAWTPDVAVDMATALAPFRPHWLEEPLPADTPISLWRELAERSPIPLATGENLRGEATFAEAIASGAFQFLQPDPIKWGGLSALREVAGAIDAAGIGFCPHYFGGGIGLIASAHLVAAAGSERSFVEVDHNDNPLRALLAMPYPRIEEGVMHLAPGPGLGVEPDLAEAKRYIVARLG